MAVKKTPVQTPAKRGKVIAEPVPAFVVPESEPDAPVVPDPEPAPAVVVADAVGGPDGGPEAPTPTAAAPKPDHIMPKPLFVDLGDDRYRETTKDHNRTVTIEGRRYEHVAEDAEGYWVYARS